MKSLEVCYGYVKTPLCRCVEYVLEYITLYVQKHIVHLTVLFWFPASSLSLLTAVECSRLFPRVTLYTAGHMHTAVRHCSHSRAPIVHTAVPRENNEHG